MHVWDMLNLSLKIQDLREGGPVHLSTAPSVGMWYISMGNCCSWNANCFWMSSEHHRGWMLMWPASVGVLALWVPCWVYRSRICSKLFTSNAYHLATTVLKIRISADNRQISLKGCVMWLRGNLFQGGISIIALLHKMTKDGSFEGGRMSF